MVELSSYVEGRWVKGQGTPAELVNPATEDVLATTSTGGIDFEGALSYARKQGGPRLRALTFAERGKCLRAMAKAMTSAREDLIALAVANGGNTRSDAKFDVDGGILALTAYADLGEALGATNVLIDGEGVALGRGARLFGRHIQVTREGVAVHVNAFNFPAWGLAEKAATALLAGMPVVTKPATATAIVAHRIVELVAAQGCLPEGALSLVCGSAGDLLDRLGPQDVIAFTGSGATAAKLRGGKSVIERGTRLNVEADSLNAAVLGPDVEGGSDLFELFVGDVAREMTQKTGQKCTAIRRVYAPRESVAEVVEGLSERLSAVKVGNPARENVTMGPLATADQLRDVRAGISILEKCARIVFGAPSEVEPIGTPPGKGYCLPPVLLHAEDPAGARAVDEHEVFGPVATIIPYDGTSDGVAPLLAAGGGSLVSSVYSDDRELVREMVLRLAPYNGRIVLGSSKVAGQSLPPGTALPQLIHGGPGRAGGGEEMGGHRGMALYMQRTAIQGDRAFVEKIA